MAADEVVAALGLLEEEEPVWLEPLEPVPVGVLEALEDEVEIAADAFLEPHTVSRQRVMPSISLGCALTQSATFCWQMKDGRVEA